MKLSLFLLSVLVVCSYASRDRNNKAYRVVCYWGSWSFYLKHFRPEDANPNICTHLIYGFAKLNEDNTIGVFDPNLDIGDTDWNSGLPHGNGGYRRFNYLRQYNPSLTTLIAIGGWNEGSNKYSNMVSSPHSRQVFINSVLNFLKEHDFDGLDLDWEYPAQAAYSEEDRVPGNLDDKQNFIALIRELRAAFQPYGYVLSAAVSPGKNTIDLGYDVPQVSNLLDFINIMGYDFHVGKEKEIAHQAPLYPRPGDSIDNQQFTVEWAVDYWIKLGADPRKLVLGMPLYARGFYMGDLSNHQIGSPAFGDGGMPGYIEICRPLKSGEMQIYREDIQKVPYAVSPARRLWIGYDDEQSLTEKLNFLKRKNLGGGMVWAIDTDDFRGECGGGKYPLLKTISRQLNGIDGPDIDIPESRPTVTQGPVTTPPSTYPPDYYTTDRNTQSTQVTQPTQPPNGSFKCHSDGYFADPQNSHIYHHCVSDHNGGYYDYVGQCPVGLKFDETVRVCVF